ncbi:hypothetical protein H6802_00975 [Candidatus Nomurabacteria bacterium]|uniref:Sporulation stage II protein D amidase enhancer LytB N-terminal domain-containing protein n=1 Tax=candidate division WWE3 bacterium TaxID=2053526 RepID=A0A955E014_UNCKA|nr:hypothetical protein [candidate division WWE3 bacterium]MCB9823517.1 hypothetical protein [Candidatus Nomurabacteria bacterium]MCB9827312.1 hypothetical protein [Candidatus Nomurabacteria bacterium]HXK52404.1 SpoIID/LytB domain-containing protein [bacterium]
MQRPAIHARKLFLILLPFLLLTTVLSYSAFADSCKNIEDLDDREKCYAKEYESTEKKLQDVREQKDSVSKKISDLSSALTVKNEEIVELQNEIAAMNSVLNQINQTLEDKNLQMAKKIELRNGMLRTFAKKGNLSTTDFELIFGTAAVSENLTGFQYATLNYIFEKSLNSDAIRTIKVLQTEIQNFERDKKEAEDLKLELESAQSNLLVLKNSLSSEKASAEGQYSELSDKEKSYSQKLSDISAKQQEILNLKAGGDNGTVGDYDSPSWKVPEPPFSPAFGAFSYGAYTHYKGMSQYGAKGRAEAGQDYKDIIKFYYKQDVKEKDDFPSKICVQGYGDLDFQYYLYGLAEMPSDWPEDALKAQAIAARTYAYRYWKSGQCICTTQSCQVFLKSKADNVPSRWKEAVDDTKKKIIDGDTTAMYASTSGGYVEPGGWDTSGSWPGGAYEKKAKSPWFYWAWYSQNYRFDSSTCGRSHPWLTEKEMADILNSWVVWDKGSNSDRDRISPVTTGCWGGNPYSLDQMASKADDYGTKYSKINSVDVTVGNNGVTTQVKFSTDKGNVTISGDVFKTVFNLRAPGYISLRSRLYDLQRE